MKKRWGYQLAAGMLSAALIAGAVQPAVAAAKGNEHKQKAFQVEQLVKKGPKGPMPKSIQVDLGKVTDKEIYIILKFSDLQQAPWAIPAIAKMKAKHVFQGYSDGTFQPNRPITQLEAIIAVVRIMGLEDEALAEQKEPDRLKKELKWLDVQAQASGYVAVALENGLLDSDFKGLQPNKPATREWVAVLLVRALGMQDEALQKMNDPLPFKDANAISLGARGYVAVAVEEGLIAGYEDRTFKPNRPVTRAEMAALLARYDDRTNQDDQRTVSGTVYDLSDDKLTVKKDNGETVTVDISDETIVLYDNRVIAVDRLQEGDKVKLVNDQDGDLLYIVLTDRAGDEEKEELSVTGVVYQLVLPDDDRKGKISVIDGNGDLKVYELGDDVDVSFDGKYRDDDGDLYDLNDVEVGDEVELTGAGQVVEKINVTDESAAFTYDGTIVAMTLPSGGRAGSLTLELGNHSRVTLAYTDDTEVYLDNERIDIDELRLNDEVRVTGNGTRVTTITIQN